MLIMDICIKSPVSPTSVPSLITIIFKDNKHYIHFVNHIALMLLKYKIFYEMLIYSQNSIYNTHFILC